MMILSTNLFDGGTLVKISLLLTSGLLIFLAIWAVRLRSFFVKSMEDVSAKFINKITMVANGGGGGGSVTEMVVARRW